MAAQSPTPDTYVRADEVSSIADVLPQILNVLQSAVVVFDTDAMLRYYNERARNLFVIDSRAPSASQSARVVLGDFSKTLLPLLARVRSTGLAETTPIRLASDGRWFDMRVTPFILDLVLVGGTDITARELRRATHEQSDQLLRAMLELMPTSVRVSDLAGRLEQVSDSAYAEHMPPRPTSLRQLWERDVPVELDTGKALSYLDSPGVRALSGEMVRGLVVEVQRGGTDAPRVIETWASPTRDAQGAITGALLIDQDITERVRVERALDDPREETVALRDRVARDADLLERLVEERARERVQLEEARSRDRRLAAVGQLAAGVMHDVNNALNPIMAAAFLLRHYAESPDAVRDYADRISKAAETAAATASRVGRFIRQDPVHAGGDESLDLSVLATEVLDLTEPMLRRGAGGVETVRVVRQLDEPVLTRGLPGEIREALLSLVQNSIDAMPNGGTLTVRTFLDGTDACVAVEDDGDGMTEEVREQAFEPFFTTKGAGGTGLGLAEVYGIARRHRGMAVIESTRGLGTTVTICLPFAASEGDVPGAAVGPPALSEPCRILVVEDHVDGRHFLRRLLESHGHIVEAVGSCADARERLAANVASPYHLLLTDVGLPDGSGWDLVAFAHDHAPQLRIGVITGWEPIVGADHAVGVEFVLQKPLRAAELLAHIAGRTPSAQTERIS